MIIRNIVTLIILAIFTSGLFYIYAFVVHANNGFSFNRESNTVNENLYVFSDNVNVVDDIDGDLVTFGGSITTIGRISGDVLAIGGNINIIGEVGGDVRVVGGNVDVVGNINGDLAMIAGTVNVDQKSLVGGNVLALAGNLIINSPVRGDIKVSSEKFVLNGQVGNSVEVKARNVDIGQNAAIGQDLQYSSFSEAQINEKATIVGSVDFRKLEQPDRTFGLGITAGFYAAVILGFLVAIAVAVMVFRKEANMITFRSISSWRSFGLEILRGFVLMVIVPIIIFILLMSVVGSLIGIILFLFYIIILILASIFEGIIFGAWISKVWHKRKDLEVTLPSSILGFAILYIIAFIPIVGWVIKLAFFLAALGSISMLFYSRIWNIGRV